MDKKQPKKTAEKAISHQRPEEQTYDTRKQQRDLEEEDDNDGRQNFGGLPNRDLKKNLGGCG